MCVGSSLHAPETDFSAGVADAECRVGRISVRGRYHVGVRSITDDYNVTSKILGKGCSGPIYLATSISDIKRRYAVKSFELASLKKIERDHLKSEIATFLCMDHPHVGRLADIYENENTLELVMECIDGGELLDRLLAKQQFDEPEAADTMRQILLAVNYLHSHKIVHRDLKLENFLYDAEDGKHLKLIDFGFSKFFTRGRLKSACGTMAYVAPEVLAQGYGSQCDLWSAGVLAFVLLSGTMPFYGSKENKWTSISSGNYKMRPDLWNPMSDQSKAFVKGLLEIDPDHRLDASRALAHPWIQENCRCNAAIPPRHVLNALSSWKSASSLQRACLTMMAWNLSPEEHVKFRDHFLALDTDHDGTISLEELKKVMTKCKMSSTKVKQVFESISSNDDDEIHYSQFIAALMSDQVIEIPDDVLRATFRKFDKRNSGYICAEDFSSIVGLEYDGTKASDLLLEADTLEQDGRIDYLEFAQYVRSGSKDKGDKFKSADGMLFQPRSQASSGWSPKSSRSGKVVDGDSAANWSPANSKLSKRSQQAKQKKQKECCTLM